MAEPDPITIRPYRPGDEAPFVALFGKVYGAGGMDLALWRWKFAQNPSGRVRIMLAEHAEHGLVGAYPSMPMHARVHGRDRLTAQIVDLMVLPAFRTLPGDRRVFVEMGTAWYDAYTGPGDDQHAFNYGWPVPAWRSGQRSLRYLNLRDWLMLHLEVELAPKTPLPADLEVREVLALGPDADALWQQLRDAWPIALRRDATYANWRYAGHPRRRYALCECRSRGDGTLRGWFAYGEGDFMRPETAFLVDWLVHPNDADAIAAMVSDARRRAAAANLAIVAAIVNPATTCFAQLQRLGFMVGNTPYFIVITNDDQDILAYRDGWFFTLGDSDLV